MKGKGKNIDYHSPRRTRKETKKNEQTCKETKIRRINKLIKVVISQKIHSNVDIYLKF